MASQPAASLATGVDLPDRHSPAYAALVKLAAPLYVQQIVPLLRDTYLPYGYLTISTLLLGILPFILGWLAVLCLCLWRRNLLKAPSLPLSLLVCSLSAAAAYCL